MMKILDWIKDNNIFSWNYLSLNPNAIELLKNNKDKIDCEMLMSNSSIFTYDYEGMKETKADLNEEVIAMALHPKRIFRLISEYGEEEIYFDD